MWRWIIITLVLVGIAAGVYAAINNVRDVDAATARRGRIDAYLDERARTRLPRTHSVTMPVRGRIRPIELAEGDTVRAGEVVARIEAADLDTALVVAEARVKRLEARIVENNDERLELSTIAALDSFIASIDRSVEASQTQTEASKAREDYRIFDLGRKEEAMADNAASLREVEEAQLAEIEAKVDFRTDVLTLRALEAFRRGVQIWPIQMQQVIAKKSLQENVLAQELAEAKATLEQARRDRQRVEIRAPVDGIVLRRLVDSERVLAPGEPLLEIGRLAELEVEVEVLSQQAVGVEPGDRVQITVPTVDHEPLAAAVQRIEPRGFTKVSSLGVEQQRVPVIVDLEPEPLDAFRDAGFALGVGYRVRARIFTDHRVDTIAIPRSALFRGTDDRWQAFVIRGGRARLVELRLGLLNDHEAEVVSGVEAGEQVILAPDTDLADGERVRPRA